MKYLMLTLIILCFSIPAVVAEDYVCASEDSLVAEQSKCKARGLDYFRHADERGCSTVTCKEVEHKCPTREELATAHDECVRQGLSTLSDIDTYDCEIYSCGSHRCPTEQEYQNSLAKCKELGRTVEELRDGEGCKYAKCLEHACDPTQLATGIAFCKKSGLLAREFVDDQGCPAVKCQKTEGSNECTKSKVEDCTIYSCSDGSSYNTCACPGPSPNAAEPAKENFFARLVRFWRGK